MLVHEQLLFQYTAFNKLNVLVLCVHNVLIFFLLFNLLLIVI